VKFNPILYFFFLMNVKYLIGKNSLMLVFKTFFHCFDLVLFNKMWLELPLKKTDLSPVM